MFEHDYIMRQFLQLFHAIERISQRQKPCHTMSAKERAQVLDDAIGEILGMDGAVVLRLAPESFVSIVKASDIDPRIGEYMVQTLVLAHYYFSLANDDRAARMRRAQADELAQVFNIDAPPNIEDGVEAFEQEIEALFVADGALDTVEAEDILGIELVDTLRRAYEIPEGIELPDLSSYDDDVIS